LNGLFGVLEGKRSAYNISLANMRFLKHCTTTL